MSSNLPKEKFKNGIHYILDEATQTYLPDFGEIEEPNYGKYGMEREKFLKEHYGATYSRMIVENTLVPHLNEIDERAEKMVDEIVAAMAAQDGTDEELKIADPMTWVGLMNNYKAAAEEVVRNELICV